MEKYEEQYKESDFDVSFNICSEFNISN